LDDAGRRLRATSEAPGMDSLVLIDRLDGLLADAKPVPLTTEARIDRDEAYRLLDQIRTTLPVEFERARSKSRENDLQESLETRLRQIGASIGELRQGQRSQAARPPRPPLTAAAAEQVREIIEAAERTASGLQQKAASEARRVQEEAQSELKAARAESERLRRESRERAAGEAAAYLRRVEEATKKMLERADAADSEMNGMLARLRGSGGSVIEDLEAITAGLNEIEVRRREKGRAREAASGGRGGSHRASPADSGDGGEAPSRRGFD
jgi:cell division septum initiation protein DivIVA